MMEDKFEIKLQVGGVHYPLTINREDEQLYRDAARRINVMLGKYKERFPNLSDEKYFVMTAIHIALMNQILERDHDQSPYSERIDKLGKEIDAFMDMTEHASESGTQE